MILRVAFQPRDVHDPERKLCIVVDVLRATSTLATMLQAGCRDILLKPTVEEARAAADGRLLCGEEGGVMPAGFNYGNSPAEFAKVDLRGKRVLFATTNGTKALQLARRSPLVFAGSILNGRSVATLALREANARGLDIEIVAAGRINGTSFSLDDTFCVGYLVSLLVEHGGFLPRTVVDRRPANRGEAALAPDGYHLHDTAIAAWRLYRSYRGEHRDVRSASLAAFEESSSGRGLRALGLGADVDYCAQPGLTPLVPQAIHDATSDQIRVVEVQE